MSVGPTECEVRLPEELEELPAGPELAQIVAGVDRRALSEQDRVRLLRARQRLVCHLQAELMADLSAVTWEDEPDPDGSGRYAWAEAEIACALRWTTVAAGRRLAQAREIIEEFPAVGAALSRGWIDLPRALVITELVEPLPDRQLAASVVDSILDRAGEWTTGQLRARLRRILLAADPGWAGRRAAAAVRGRRVELRDNEDGTGELWGRSLPPRDVAMVWERLSAIARAAKSAGDGRSFDQLRADAMVDLLAGEGVAVGGQVGRHTGGLPVPDGDPGSPMSRSQLPAARMPDVGCAEPTAERPKSTGDLAVMTGAGARAGVAAGAGAGAGAGVGAGATAVALPGPRRGVVELQVPLTTLLGLSELPGELRGFGPVVADIARQVAAEQLPGSWRYSVLNELGEVVCHGPVKARPTTDQGSAAAGAAAAGSAAPGAAAARRPSAGVAALVRARNATCVAPGCRRPASSCDLDHTVDWAEGGASTADNLGPLCRRHHRFKHQGGAEVIQPTPGVFGWTTPRGMQYVTVPEPALDLAPWEAVPSELPVEPVSPPTAGAGLEPP